MVTLDAVKQVGHSGPLIDYCIINIVLCSFDNVIEGGPVVANVPDEG
jgi:hypothetical protein